MEKTTGREYAELQQGMDTLIGKFGVPKTLKIITQLSGTVKARKQKRQLTRLITTFVISEAFKIFEVGDDVVPKDPLSNAYKEARKASYHLLNLYTELSYKEIGKHFNQGKFGAYYHIRKCRESLSLPKYNKPFIARYEVLEENLIEFIAKLN